MIYKKRRLKALNRMIRRLLLSTTQGSEPWGLFGPTEEEQQSRLYWEYKRELLLNDH